VFFGFFGLKVGEAFRQPQKQSEIGLGNVGGAGVQVPMQIGEPRKRPSASRGKPRKRLCLMS